MKKLISKRIYSTIAKFKKEIKSHKVVYAILIIASIGGLFIRTYRTDQILGFYYDQGRDAIKVWDFWHNGDVMLIGPTTGIAGIFRGPFYFYLIAPFYLLGGGNPVVVSYFLSILSMIAVLVVYIIGCKIQDRATGLIAAILASFSFYIMVASRWLSNPTPMLLLSVLLLLMMYLVHEGKKWPWIFISLISGFSLFHFGSSGEVFYFPTLAIFFGWQVLRHKKLGIKNALLKVINMKVLFFSVIAFAFTLSPLILFEFLKDHQLSENVKKFLVEDQSFKINFTEILKTRLIFYYDVFSTKIFHWRRTREIALLVIVGMSFIFFLPRFIKVSKINILLLFLLSPTVGLLFFQGNFGNIYDYYLTGYYLPFILLFAIVLGQIWKYKIGKLFVVYFFYVFLSWNGMVSRYHIIAGVDGPETILYGNQMQSIEWVYENATKYCLENDKNCRFNVDVYVPPVIPHAYDYLFTWYPTTLDNTKVQQVDEQVSLLYTLYEVDPPHPERLVAWLERQRGIGDIKEEVQFGGITVQRRERTSDGTK